MTIKLFISPAFRGEDKGDGGIRRVIEAQHKHLPALGYEMVGSIDEADIVHSHAGVLLDVPPSKPFVTTCHGLYWDDYKWSKWHYDLNGQVCEALRRADVVISPSEWVSQALRRDMWIKPYTIGHGVDVADWTFDTDHDGYVLWNKSRPDPVCDPYPVGYLAALMPEQKFVTTYYPPDFPIDNVEETGVRPFAEAKSYLARAGVYLCTTRETFGIGTLEAMACGVPVVGWAWGGQRDIIEHKVDGWISAPGDFEALAEGIRWALANRRQVAARARAKVEACYTWEHAIKAHDSLYRDVINDLEDFATKAPKVSIVVPCYNLAKYLPDTIKSLQAQTMTDWEVTIVDDASTDNTQEVAHELARHDKRISVFTNLTNQYLAGALNIGIEQATAPHVMALDADNMLAPRALEFLLAPLEASREIDIAYGAVQFIKDDGTLDRSIGENGVSTWPGEFDFAHQIQGKNQIPSTCLYRRRVWERTGGYRRRWRTSEDADFWTRATSYGMRAKRVTRGVTLIYRLREGQMSAVNAKPNYVDWYPWSRHRALAPAICAAPPPENINGGYSWHVPTCEPPRVSIIIPCGSQHRETLIDALDSVEAQTFRKWEVIVVNDTSDDLRVPHPWVKVRTPWEKIRDGKSVGPAAARNYGVGHTSAPLLIFLDADDYLQPMALETLIDQHDELGGIVYGQWWDDKGDEVTLFDPIEFDPSSLIAKGCLHAVTALYPRSAFNSVGGFDEELSHWEDWDLQIACAAAGICSSKVALPIFTYRKTTGARREANAAQFERGKAAILSKWERFWNGQEDIMAGCSGCPGARGTTFTPRRQPLTTAPSEGMEAIEYTGTKMGTMTYRPPGSGVTYSFAAGANARRFVYTEHVEWFLSKGEFKRAVIVTPSDLQPQLVATSTPAPKTYEGETTGNGNGTVEAIRQYEASPDFDPGPEVGGAMDPEDVEPQPEDLHPDFSPLNIGEYTPTTLNLNLNALTQEQAAEALANERGGRNRSPIIKILRDYLLYLAGVGNKE